MKKLKVNFVYSIFTLVFIMFLVSSLACTSIMHVKNDTVKHEEKNLNDKNLQLNSQSGSKKVPEAGEAQIKARLNRLNADLDTLEKRMESQEDSIRKIKNRIDRLEQLNKKPPNKRNSFASIPKSFRKKSSPKAGSSHTKMNFPVYTTPEKLYKKARSLLLEENFKQAAILFTRFIKKYPHNELADNSVYWLGECHYSMGDYKGAVKIFKGLVQKYPRAGKVPDALLKTAYAYLALDDTDRANYFLKQVVTKYPFTDAGDKAALKLRAFQ